jgi:hypothetical protein
LVRLRDQGANRAARHAFCSARWSACGTPRPLQAGWTAARSKQPTCGPASADRPRSSARWTAARIKQRRNAPARDAGAHSSAHWNATHSVGAGVTRRAIIRANDPPIPADQPPEGTSIDIIFLVERLESQIANGRRLPLTSNVVVDQAAALSLIDELRVAVPEEVRAAKRINSEGERIIEKAQEEAERIVARAQEQAAFLIDERGLTQQAEAESRRIIAEANEGAEEVRRGADEYAVNVLIGLEGDVVRTLQSIKKGIGLLDERRADLRAPAADGGLAAEGGDGEETHRDYDIDDEEDAELPVRR